MAALNLHHLAHQVSVKRARPRSFEKQLVQLRRSSRVSNHDAPVYKQVVVYRAYMVGSHMDQKVMSSRPSRVYAASDEAIAAALRKARELEAALGSHHPTIVKTMFRSFVTGGFFLVKEILGIGIRLLYILFSAPYVPRKRGRMDFFTEDYPGPDLVSDMLQCNVACTLVNELFVGLFQKTRIGLFCVPVAFFLVYLINIEATSNMNVNLFNGARP